ncbi:MAG TPA: hypothetical protein PK253_09640 [Spirochaetota bacterium]|nr:hypothetical protein [Spirochaetota bacterium]
MAGYTIKKILPDEICLVPSRPPFFLMIFIALGITFLLLGALTKMKIINPPAQVFYLFIGLGMGFTAAGPLFMIRKMPDRILFNKTSGSIQFYEKSVTVELPFSGFSRFDISGKLSHTENSGPSFTLDLVSTTGSRLTLKESSNIIELTEMAEKIVPYIDIDILRQGTLIHEGTRHYASPKSSSLPDPSLSSVQMRHILDTDTYTWKSRKTLWSLFLVAVIFAGMNIMFFMWAYPMMSPLNFGKYIITGFMALINVLLLFTMAYHAVGTSRVTVSPDYFAFEQIFLGFKLSSRVLPREEIAFISSGFSGDDNKITIFTKAGKELHDTLIIEAARANLRDRSILFSLIPKLMQLRNEIIEIDGSPLYFYEKLLLEKQWSNTLNLTKESGI